MEPPMQEINYNLNAEFDNTFALLKLTFPRRYLHLDRTRLQEKVVERPRPSQSKIKGLRIFKHETAGMVDMCAFFFVRLKHNPPAYTMTVGVDPNIDPQNPDRVADLLYDELKTTCTFMQGEAGGGVIDVVNERKLPDDLTEAGGAQIVKTVFNTAIRDGNLSLTNANYVTGAPWPPVMYRYTVANPIIER
jgi:hypothetical protein